MHRHMRLCSIQTGCRNCSCCMAEQSTEHSTWRFTTCPELHHLDRWLNSKRWQLSWVNFYISLRSFLHQPRSEISTTSSTKTFLRPSLAVSLIKPTLFPLPLEHTSKLTHSSTWQQYSNKTEKALKNTRQGNKFVTCSLRSARIFPL